MHSGLSNCQLAPFRLVCGSQPLTMSGGLMSKKLLAMMVLVLCLFNSRQAIAQAHTFDAYPTEAATFHCSGTHQFNGHIVRIVVTVLFDTGTWYGTLGSDDSGDVPDFAAATIDVTPVFQGRIGCQGDFYTDGVLTFQIFSGWFDWPPASLLASSTTPRFKDMNITCGLTGRLA